VPSSDGRAFPPALVDGWRIAPPEAREKFMVFLRAELPAAGG